MREVRLEAPRLSQRENEDEDMFLGGNMKRLKRYLRTWDEGTIVRYNTLA
jgi:hypothetical protein